MISGLRGFVAVLLGVAMFAQIESRADSNDERFPAAKATSNDPAPQTITHRPLHSASEVERGQSIEERISMLEESVQEIQERLDELETAQIVPLAKNVVHRERGR